ncbi:hypothetical protein PtrV1_12928 [Pyrenophora tritici-repentis]|uniref:Uncharacterized protein n=1 Tax=Pyrenophora tritici-repentis TaxID=45151 RepID=A0A5M9KM25_9PLEO|nr:hypothetical protein PtrV1_12928 [Pyrenophora tritici-repentis]KAI0571076.1 hypothetical protein Alg215_10632 [Pyrenophora tritici-repentis]KAI1510810.1 hypothetical protein Ptr86124_009931 [Pyrenophora tritici-repentis]KAI1526376.1 hypothetical protein PtrSN001C_010261 [Pyrenophora tritici-repentis]KAI1561844.1 hypothetical protein PtrEW4_010343 [Pyrenophora tritici-repentis]
MPSDSPLSEDYSWQKAKPLWILVIVIGTLLALYILYKITRCILRRWENTHARVSTAGPLGGDAVDSSTTTPRWDDARARERHSDGEITRPATAVTRQNSSNSILPRYEKFDEDGKCREEVKVEKRGRYTYALGERFVV